MKIEDIVKPVYPVKEYKSGNITTRIQLGPKFSVTRSINFAGREIPLTQFSIECPESEAVREPTVKANLSPVGRVEAVRSGKV